MRNDGGPAFQGKKIDKDDAGFTLTDWSGMSLRDYFAAAALKGFLSGETTYSGANPPAAEAIATIVYRMADAMLEEREKEGGV